MWFFVGSSAQSIVVYTQLVLPCTTHRAQRPRHAGKYLACRYAEIFPLLCVLRTPVSVLMMFPYCNITLLRARFPIGPQVARLKTTAIGDRRQIHNPPSPSPLFSPPGNIPVSTQWGFWQTPRCLPDNAHSTTELPPVAPSPIAPADELTSFHFGPDVPIPPMYPPARGCVYASS